MEFRPALSGGAYKIEIQDEQEDLEFTCEFDLATQDISKCSPEMATVTWNARGEELLSLREIYWEGVASSPVRVEVTDLESGDVVETVSKERSSTDACDNGEERELVTHTIEVDLSANAGGQGGAG